MRDLTRSEQVSLFNNWIKYSRDIVIILDSHYQVVFYNQRLEKYLKDISLNSEVNDLFYWCKQWKADFSELKTCQTEVIELSNSLELSIDNIVYFIDWTVIPVIENQEKQYFLLGNEIQQSRLYLRSPKEDLYYIEEFFHDFPSSIFWKDEKGIYLGCNPFTASLAGVEHPSQVIGKTDDDFLWASKEEIEQVKKNDKEVIMSGKGIIFEEEATRTGGEKVTFLVYKIPIKKSNNNVAGIMGVALNITEYKSREKQLAASKKSANLYLENIVRNLSGSVFWKDLEGRFLGCNQVVADMAGVESPKELIGKTDYDFCWTKEDADLARKYDKTVTRTGQPMRVEESATLPDGREIALLTQKAPLFDDAGNIIGVIGTAVDLTSHKKLEKELKEAKKKAEAYLQNAVEQIPGNISWKDDKGVYLGCNSRFAKRTGLTSPQQVIGKTDKDLIWGDISIAEKTYNKKIIKQGIEEEIEEEKQQLDGKKCIYLTKKSPLQNQEGKTLGIISISFDVTERRLIEQRRLATLESLGTIVAHEMRTPLLSINSAAEGIKTWSSTLLSNKELSFSENQTYKKMLNLLSNIMFEVDSATLVVNMILENVKFSKSKNVELTRQTIIDCVQTTLDRYPLYEHHEGLIHLHVNEDFVFLGEKHLFAHVLFNLIKNALYFIDAAEKGEIFIWTEKTDSMNLLHFKDTGMGIKSEELSNIFEKFYSRRYHGVGLGLAFCKMVMDKFGGDITCHSEYGEYTEFILAFPRVE